MSRPSASLVGFLLCAFGVVGLTGLFATFATPLPLERAVAREEAIDAAARLLGQPGEAQGLAALAPELGAQAGLLADAARPPAERVAQARVAARAEFRTEAAVIEQRMRWLVLVVTICAAAFGTALLLVAARGDRGR